MSEEKNDKEKDYEEGQKDGSKSGSLSEMEHEWGGKHFRSDHYNLGFQHGVQNRPQTSYDQSSDQEETAAEKPIKSGQQNTEPTYSGGMSWDRDEPAKPMGIMGTLVVCAILLTIVVVIGWQIQKTNESKVVFVPSPPEVFPDKIIFHTKWGNVETKNFYKNTVETIDETFFLKKEPSFNIGYFRPDGTILIALKTKPILQARKDAENSLLEIMGIDKESACKLNVSVEVPVSIDEKYAGRNLGLSFCSGN